jgi:sporulation protein YlmC with PRC-barrel domain
VRTLIASTAMALVLAGPIWAQQQTEQPAGDTTQVETQTMAQGGFYEPQQSDMLVANLIGAQVYAPQTGEAQTGGTAQPAETDAAAAEGAPETQPLEAETAETAPEAGGTATMAGGSGPISQDELNQMENIGAVDDMIIDEQGELQAVVLDIGGFLGIGSRVVALSTDEIDFRRGQDDPSEIYVVSRAGSDTLENAPEFDRSMLEDQEMAQADGEAAPATAESQPMAQDEMAGDTWRGDRQPMVAPDMQREGYAMAEAQQFTADTLMGANVYDANDENIGSVSDVVVSQADGSLEAVVIDVGGFLGLGTHTVAVGLDEMTVLQSEDGSDLRAYVDVTQEQLESMPEFDEAG